MVPRFVPVLFVIFALQASQVYAESPAAQALTVTAQTPKVSVSRGLPGRHLLKLPTLEYAFEIAARCRDNAIPQSLSINVADSRRTLSTPELGATGQQKIVLTVPARQIAPIPVNEFCVIDAVDADNATIVSPVTRTPAPTGTNPEQITVAAALSAQISLLCVSESGSEQKMNYVTKPLAVTLTCEVPAARVDAASHTAATDR